MIRLIVEIQEVGEGKETTVGFKTEEDQPTEAEMFWKERLYPVLKESLNMRGLLGERAFLSKSETKT